MSGSDLLLKSYDFDESLSAFIKLGAEIINTKTSERYGWQFNNNVVLQPGFMPLDAPPKVVFIGINPSANNPVNLDEEKRLYLEWGKNPGLETYRTAFSCWANNNVRQWTVYRTVAGILDRHALRPESGHLGWLNIAKVPDNNMSAITEQIATRDLPWLKRQLRMMGPDIFVILGSNAARYKFIERYLKQTYGPNRVGVRGQRGDGESVNDIAVRLGAWLSR